MTSTNCQPAECRDDGYVDTCYEAPPPPTRILGYRDRIALDPTVAGLALSPRQCGCAAGPVDITKLAIWVRRRGQATWLLRYPAWDFDDVGGVIFRFDSQLFALPAGRYEAELRSDGTPCAGFEISLGAACPLTTRGAALVTPRVTQYPPRPTGVLAVFNGIEMFTATLCAILERDATVLPLSSAQASALCAATPCKPVQLIITDGVVTETVLFSGCVSGSPVVTRGSPRFRFPAGATVRFVWTTANVQAAMTPCP